mmetsp:Transcript_65863/g.136309  ORF Transcript_65863/g.136309 Transcript_65863/m.136309 type:complete len:122 (-) Transcript_65863:1434-1799(-)
MLPTPFNASTGGLFQQPTPLETEKHKTLLRGDQAFSMFLSTFLTPAAGPTGSGCRIELLNNSCMLVCSRELFGTFSSGVGCFDVGSLPHQKLDSVRSACDRSCQQGCSTLCVLLLEFSTSG